MPHSHPRLLKSANPALLVIDVQEAIDHFHTPLQDSNRSNNHPNNHGTSQRNNPNAEKVIAQLLHHWREAGLPIVHIRHASKFPDSPYHPDSPYYGFKKEAAPQGEETVITKSENCAFINTNLNQWLQDQGVTELVICGVLINHSIDATVRVAAANGYSVFLPQDATAAFPLARLDGKSVTAEDVHWIFLSNLQGEYAQVARAQDLI